MPLLLNSLTSSRFDERARKLVLLGRRESASEGALVIGARGCERMAHSPR